MAKKYSTRTPRVSAYDSGRDEKNQDAQSWEKKWDRYGLTESEWKALEPEQRVDQYVRQNVCEHKPDISSWPKDLREAFSADPYFHTCHMDPCKRWGIKPPERWSIPCSCQMCLKHIGLAIGSIDRENSLRSQKE